MKITNTIISLISSLLIIGNLNAQSPSFEWVAQLSGVGRCSSNFITTDSHGNTYTVGDFNGTTDFDPGIGMLNWTSSCQYSPFILALDSLSNFLWMNSLNTSTAGYYFGVSVDPFGNIYAIGTFVGNMYYIDTSGYVNFTSIGSGDIFIQKFNASGSTVWIKQMGGLGFDYGTSIITDANGNVYTTGHFEGTVDFDPGPGVMNFTSNGSSDIFIQKIDSSGNMIWTKQMGGTGADKSTSLTMDINGDMYTTGKFQATADFDPGIGIMNLTSNGTDDVFIQKMDSSGNIIWAKHMGGPVSDEGTSITTDANGDVYTTGSFYQTGDFDPGPGITNLTSSGGKDMFIQKLSSSGNLIWVKRIGGSASDQGKGIICDPYGYIYTTGYFIGTVDFNPNGGVFNLTSILNSPDIFIQKIDASGNFIWARKIGGPQQDISNSITTDLNGNIYTTGYFNGTADLNPGVGNSSSVSFGSEDVFILKLGLCQANFSTDTRIKCDSYRWIDGNTYTSSNNTATHTLSNSSGCDSIITLDLTINSVSNTTTTINGTTIASINILATHQWLDCNNNYQPISGETSTFFTPSQIGSYAVELNEDGCLDTSDCITIDSVALSIIDNINQDHFVVYPNPTSSKFLIQFENIQDKTVISITNIMGKSILNRKYLNISQIELDINSSAGVYFVNIQTPKNNKTIRLIKN